MVQRLPLTHLRGVSSAHTLTQKVKAFNTLV